MITFVKKNQEKNMPNTWNLPLQTLLPVIREIFCNADELNAKVSEHPHLKQQ